MSLAGRTVSHYRVIEEISRGGMGIVDRATDTRFTRIAPAGWARLFTPIEYFRSLYYRGQIAEQQGDRAKARDDYGRFLKYRKDGDTDRDQVAEALNKIGS